MRSGSARACQPWLALAAGVFLFSIHALADTTVTTPDTPVGEMSAGQIEQQLQVR